MSSVEGAVSTVLGLRFRAVQLSVALNKKK